VGDFDEPAGDDDRYGREKKPFHFVVSLKQMINVWAVRVMTAQSISPIRAVLKYLSTS
jgi:hypothetical protein